MKVRRRSLQALIWIAAALSLSALFGTTSGKTQVGPAASNTEARFGDDSEDTANITLRMLDGKTGQPMSTSESQLDFWVGTSLQPTQRADIGSRSVRPDKSGSAEITLPAASFISVHARYGNAGSDYVNCDRIKTRAPFRYSVSQILTTGVAAPNYCSKRKADAKPGEFVFFVRPMTLWEKMK